MTTYRQASRLANPFPTFGIVLTVSAFAATLALWYLGDGRSDWWLAGVLTVYTTRWSNLVVEDLRAWRAGR